MRRQTFDDRGLADAGLADQHRIVLGPPRQHLNGPADFLVAADHRSRLAVTGGLRQVAGIFLQRVIGVFGRGQIRCAALAQRLDGAVEILRRNARLLRSCRPRCSFPTPARAAAARPRRKLSPAFSPALGGIEDASKFGRDRPGRSRCPRREILAQRGLDRLAWQELPPERSIKARRQPFRSSSKTLEVDRSGANCWWPSRRAIDCADWTNTLARSVYFSKFITTPSAHYSAGRNPPRRPFSP